MTLDPHGTLNPAFDESKKRFNICYKRPELDEEPGWRYKLYVRDNKYLDSDSLPILVIAGGDNYSQAFKEATRLTEAALNSNTCIF